MLDKSHETGRVRREDQQDGSVVENGKRAMAVV